MFGFVIGFACLWGLVRVVRGGRGHGHWGRGRWGGSSRWGRSGGCGGRWGDDYESRRGGFGEDGFGDDGPDFRRARRGRGWMRMIFRRLDTSPTQEKAVQAAVDEVMDAGRALKDDVRGSRKEVAEAFRTDDFNEELMATLLTRHDDRIDELRRAMVSGLASIHATLDPDQRKQIARMLERGPGWGGGPYRGDHA